MGRKKGARRGKRTVETSSKLQDKNRLATALTVGLLGVIGLIVGSCLVFGVAYVGAFIDDTAYHIPNAVRIAQHLNPYASDGSPVDSHWFPAAAETGAAVLVAATGHLGVVNLTGALCFLAIAMLLYRFAGLWCSDRVGRLAAVACACTIPLMTAQCTAFYVDIHMALVVCLALYALCRSLISGRADLAYYAAAVALCAPGVKYSGILIFLVLIAGCAFALWQAQPPRRPGWRATSLLAAAGAFSSGWYLRNWLERGNPLYPFAFPRWLEPVRGLTGVLYEYDPEHFIGSPTTDLPHPWIPATWLQHEYTPHMSADAFGLAGVIALGCGVLSLLVLRRLPSRERRAWLFLLIILGVLIAVFPYGARIPRYILFVPLLLSLAPALLCAAARGVRERVAARALCAAILLWSVVYANANLLTPQGIVTNNLSLALSLLRPYDPAGIRRYEYVRRGHLRIGYTSGFGNFIGSLYDLELTNRLFPLHYKNYPFNYGREKESEQAFLDEVAALDLDYIHIFDERYPGVSQLRANFPDKIMPREMRRDKKTH